eukprot:4642142-Amphidinium_carterae.1
MQAFLKQILSNYNRNHSQSAAAASPNLFYCTLRTIELKGPCKSHELHGGRGTHSTALICSRTDSGSCFACLTQYLIIRSCLVRESKLQPLMLWSGVVNWQGE